MRTRSNSNTSSTTSSNRTLPVSNTSRNISDVASVDSIKTNGAIISPNAFDTNQFSSPSSPQLRRPPPNASLRKPPPPPPPLHPPRTVPPTSISTQLSAHQSNNIIGRSPSNFPKISIDQSRRSNLQTPMPHETDLNAVASVHGAPDVDSNSPETQPLLNRNTQDFDDDHNINSKSAETTIRMDTQNLNASQALRDTGNDFHSRTEATENINNNTNRFHDTNATWILKIRIPSSPYDTDSINPGNLLQILVTPTMSADDLSSCIQQGMSSLVTQTSHQELPRYPNQSQFIDKAIAGLFVEESGIFVSLHSLLLSSTLVSASVSGKCLKEQVFCLHQVSLPPNHRHPKRNRFSVLREYPELLYAFGIVFLAWSVYYYEMMGTAQRFIVEAYYFWYNTTIESPLQEIYRNGPWFVGWEGDSLPRICSRITYHGDERFWSGANLFECQAIYQSKENAFLRIARPIIYSIYTLILISFVRFVVWEWNRIILRRQQGQHVDREVMETYRAFQVILRQFRKTSKGVEP